VAYRHRRIGFSGQMHGTVMVTAASIHPAIIWGRSAQQRGRQPPDGDVENAVLAITARSRRRVSGATLVWLAEHEPELLEFIHKVILPKDYVRLKMTDGLLPMSATPPPPASSTSSSGAGRSAS
jgi:xylulokinase